MTETSKKPMKAPYPVETVQIEQLDLDLKNSRFPRDAQSPKDALELMLRVAGDECMELMRDLTSRGELNSSDLPIVVAKGGRYVVMEGNRRLTCLRLWQDVALLETNESIAQRYQARFERLINESPFQPPTSIRVAIAPAEDDADRWLEKKHADGAGGAGTVPWGAAMKDRRRARNDPSLTSRAMAFVELVSSEFKDDADILADLDTVSKKRYTMLQRFVNRSAVRELVGLNFETGVMSFEHGPEATREVVRSVLHDFAQPKAKSGKSWARELDTVEDFRNYLEAMPDLLPAGQSVEGTTETEVNPEPQIRPDAPGSGSPESHLGGERGGTTFPFSTPPDSGTPPPRPPRPVPAQTHIFRSLVLDRFTDRIQEIVRQTSMVNVQRNNEIAAVLLRVILELTTYQFLKSHGKDAPNRLDARIRASIKVIDPQASDMPGTAEDTPSIRKAFHQTTAEDIRLVQYAVHDINSGRTPRETFVLAARYEPVLVEMNASMGKESV